MSQKNVVPINRTPYTPPPPPPAKNYKAVERDGGLISPLAFDLFSHVTPHKHEHHLDFLFKDMFEAKTAVKDEVGNIIIRIGELNKDYNTMFSCHMDTVQHVTKDRTDPAMTSLVVGDGGPDDHDGFLYACDMHWNEVKKQFTIDRFNVLGGDDRCGMYIMLHMIQAKIPGLYVFHVGEEVGCVGSIHISKKTPEVIKDIKRCIAFDRKDYTDVIAFQHGTRCASAEFTNALADALNAHTNTPRMKYKGDVTGVYTDSATYMRQIPECTNISVGYFSAHSTSEKVDILWLEKVLTPAVLKVEWEKLPTVRDHTAVTTYSSSTYSKRRHWEGEDEYGGYYGNYYGGYYGKRDTVVDVKSIGMSTPYASIPDWSWKDGLLTGVSRPVMKRIIDANLTRGKGSMVSTAIEIISEMLEHIDELEMAVAEHEQALAELGIDFDGPADDPAPEAPVQQELGLAADPNDPNYKPPAEPTKQEVVKPQEVKTESADRFRSDEVLKSLKFSKSPGTLSTAAFEILKFLYERCATALIVGGSIQASDGNTEGGNEDAESYEKLLNIFEDALGKGRKLMVNLDSRREFPIMDGDRFIRAYKNVLERLPNFYANDLAVHKLCDNGLRIAEQYRSAGTK